MTDALSIAKKYFNVVPRDAGEYKTVKSGMMTANAEPYYIEGVGSMTFQKAKAMFGLMKMDMMVITPRDRDLPLFSFDIIDAMGNYTLIIEMYDVMLNKSEKFEADINDFVSIKNKYKDLPDNDLGEHWYDNLKLTSCVSKKAKKKDIAEACDKLYAEYLEKYFEMAKSMEEVEDKDAKRIKSEEYVNGLLSNGGPSTDQFVKMIGLEKTTEYFSKVIFGTAKELS